ncbi:MAG: hypothetical protein WBW31_19120 [Candidatus Sulfotelmatobacter sp.]
MQYDLTKYDEAFKLLQNYQSVPSPLRQILVFVALNIDFTDNDNKELVQALFGEIGNVPACLESIKRQTQTDCDAALAALGVLEGLEVALEPTELEEAQTEYDAALTTLGVFLEENGLDAECSVEDILALDTTSMFQVLAAKAAVADANNRCNMLEEDALEEDAVREKKAGAGAD